MRFKQRLFHNFSRSAVFDQTPEFNPRSFDPAIHTSLALLESSGWRTFDGAGMVGILDPVQVNVMNNCIYLSDNLNVIALAEWCPATGVDAACIRSRVARAEFMMDYVATSAFTAGLMQIAISCYNPANIVAGPFLNFRISAPAVNAFTETIVDPVGLRFNFASDRDLMMNRIKISVVRAAAATKNVSVTYWNRTTGLPVTVGPIACTAGAIGDNGVIWAITMPGNNCSFMLTSLQTSHLAIPYGSTVPFFNIP
jgi:hypothetical protein